MEGKLIYEKIPLIMKEAGGIAKDRENKAQSYMFRGIDDVINVFNPLFVKHSVCPPMPARILEKDVQVVKDKNGKPMVHAVVIVEYVMFAEDGSEHRGTVMGEGSDWGDKAVNKAMTSAQKNFYLQTFAIPTDEPKDSENDHPEMGNGTGQKTPPAEKKAPPTDGDALADDVKKEIGQIMMTSVNNKPVFGEVDKQKVRAALGTIKSLAGLVSLKDSCQRRLEASIPMKEAV
jgi:hypothetical protein